ncbi:hypothetical protein HRbin39_00113 [bacterium HR39]|nr:hypothetical protein HRbin39_00113 [bacterium HR39]
MVVRITNRRNGGRGYYVGRPSPLGNPYRMTSEADRERVIRMYAEWLRAHMHSEPVRSELNRLYKELVRTGDWRD